MKTKRKNPTGARGSRTKSKARSTVLVNGPGGPLRLSWEQAEKLGLTDRLGVRPREQQERQKTKAAGRSRQQQRKHWRVTWYSKKRGKRTGFIRPIAAANAAAAIRQARAMIENDTPINMIAELAKRENPPPPRKPVRTAKSPKQNPQQLLTPAQLAHLRDEFGKLDNVDLKKYRSAFQEVFAGVRTPLLRQLAQGRLEGVSPLAKNAYMRRMRNPQRGNPMHPLEVGSHVAIILGGLEQVREMIRRRKTSRKRSTRNPKLHKGDFRPVMTYELAMAAGRDAANARMRKAGRKKWNKADYNEAVKVFKRLYKLVPKANPPQRNLGLIGLAENLQAAEYLKKKLSAEKQKRNSTRVSNPNSGKLFEKFTGKKRDNIESGYMWPGPAPKNIDQLGRLSEIHLSNPGERVDNSKCGRGLGPCHCTKVLRFSNNPAKLCATQKGGGRPRFIVALKKKFEMPPQLNPASEHDYGEA